MEYLEIYNFIISNLVLVSQIFLVIIILGLFLNQRLIKDFCQRFYLQISLLFSSSAFIGSMIYSNVIGFTPCTLCYWQRIFMYPIVFISGLAILKKEKLSSDYLITFSGIGMLISIYHVYLQFTPNPLPCSVSGQGVSCSDNWVLEYGYITIPVMALTCFTWIFVVNIINKTKK